jgi:hypothetical protein
MLTAPRAREQPPQSVRWSARNEFAFRRWAGTTPTYATRDYAPNAKLGFLAGLALWTVGALGGVVGPALFGPLPGWETMLLADAEVLGVPVGLLSLVVFGVELPLAE